MPGKNYWQKLQILGARYEPTLRDFYQNFLQKGKAKKVALTAVMRKLLIHLNSLMRRYLENNKTAS